MAMELPEGISYNNIGKDPLEIVIPVLSSIQWSCTKCELKLEALLLTTFERFEGIIRNVHTQVEVWSNKLPRDEKRARAMLQENLDKRVERHEKGH